MFPLYCNKCFRRYKTEPTSQFWVSRCGHIMCKECQQDTCPICSKPFTGIAFDRNMPPAMVEYFTDPLKLLRHFQKITKFQYDQEKVLVEYLRNSNENGRRKLKENQSGLSKIKQSLKQKVDQERERIRKYREYIAYYERRFEQTRFMTPPITAPPRPRYPARKSMLDPTKETISATVVDYMPQLTQTIKASFPVPRSPTLSTNDGSSVTSKGIDMAQTDLSRKTTRTPPPLVPCSEMKKVKQNFSYQMY